MRDKHEKKQDNHFSNLLQLHESDSVHLKFFRCDTNFVYHTLDPKISLEKYANTSN